MWPTRARRSEPRSPLDHRRPGGLDADGARASLPQVVGGRAPAAEQPKQPALVDLFGRYERGEFSAAVSEAAQVVVRNDLRVAIRDLNFAVPMWFPENEANERRRLAVAAFALEFVMVRRADLWKDSGYLLLEWACSLLRRNPTPLPAERLWHLAAIGVIEGAADGVRLEAHLAHAERRFPDEPRFLLARAVAMELLTWPEEHGKGLTRDRLPSPAELDVPTRVRRIPFFGLSFERRARGPVRHGTP